MATLRENATAVSHVNLVDVKQEDMAGASYRLRSANRDNPEAGEESDVNFLFTKPDGVTCRYYKRSQKEPFY